jgi:AraC-like DNA-binding protein
LADANIEPPFTAPKRAMERLPRSDELSALYCNCVLRSDERVAAHEQVCRELTDHGLRWKRGAPDAAMYKGRLSNLEMYLLRYGAEVEVTPRPFDDFMLVHTSLAGGAEVDADGQRLEVAEGRTVTLAPRRAVRLHWYPGTQQLIVKVPHALLRALAGVPADEPLSLDPGYLIGAAQSSQWALLTRSVLNAMSLPCEGSLQASWLDHFERTLASFLLAHKPQTTPTPPHKQERIDSTALASGHPRLDALMDYIDARLCAPITLEDLARAAGVSVRTLNELCRRRHGVTPMELLRNRRLDAAHARLRLEPELSITETAYALGFGHLGRFAQYYCERFGELPRETQLRNRGPA